jgi:outer membrane usher protein
MRLKTLISSISLMLASGSAWAVEIEPLVLGFNVNGVNKGEIEIQYDFSTNDIYIDQNVIEDLGINLQINSIQKLNEIERLESIFDITKMEVSIKTDGSLIESDQSFSLAGRSGYEYSESVNGGYLNYAVNADSEGRKNFNYELGLNLFNKRFNSTLACGELCQIGSYSITVDNDEDLTQTVFGDFISPSGDRLLGFNYGKKFRINPFFFRQPTLGFDAIADTQSRVELIVDGVTQFTKNVQPGKFSVNDIRQFNGRHDVELRVTDAFGNVSSTYKNFAASSTLLSNGLNDYSFSAGFLRRGTDLTYTDLALNGFFRRGFTNNFTAGVNFSATELNQEVGFDYNYLLSNGALLSGNSALRSDSSYLLESTLSNQNKSNDMFWSLTGQVSKSVFQSSLFSEEDYEQSVFLNASVSKRYKKFGLNAGVSSESKTSGTITRLNLGASIPLSKPINGSFLTSASFANNGEYQLMMSLNLSLDRNKGATISVDNKNGVFSNNQSLYTSSLDPRDLNIRAIRNEANGFVSNNISATKGFESAYTSAGCFETAGYTNCELQAAGSLVFTQKTGLIMSRPVKDALLVVDVGAADLEVGVNGVLSSKSNKNGMLVLPEVAPYSVGQVYLNSDSIPDGYSSDKASDKYLIRQNGIGFTSFGVKKISAVFGKLIGKKSVNYTLDGKYKSFTSNTGEFYSEDLEAGKHVINIEYFDTKTGVATNEKCEFESGKTDEAIEDVGSISCVASST